MLPLPGSTFAPEVDALFYFIFYTALVLFVLVITVMIYFGIKYRQKSKETPLTSGVDKNHLLEFTWTIIPTILVVIVFFWGFNTYMTMNVVPKDALEIKVTGQKWFWSFDYPEGFNSVHELTVPVNKPVKLVMSSKDVIHSFFVPDFRVKMDVLPNRYTITWFEANKLGQHHLFCAEYCGKGHSEMLGSVNVVTEEDYALWLEKSQTVDESIPLEELGEMLYTKKACVTCHTLDGSILVGPSLLGIFGSVVYHTDGSQVVADENYLRKSILNPQADVVVGFDPVMPTFQGILRDREIDGLVAYIKTLKK
ncbi:MAG: cytochrome c oxidase subunit II [FCB group bacterium]|nr:cytochrome c oxidase subunit II [FCB group bacterium]